MNLISASRRTDIPHYFAKWFAERRKAGFAEFRNAFGGKGRVSLHNEDVLGYLFWTKYAHSFQSQLQALRDEGIPYVFQYTITGYGHDLEPHIPRLENVIDNFIAISKTLPSPECIQWRYDPIVISKDCPMKFHLDHFRAIASALQGYTRIVNVSFPEPYAKTVRRMNELVEVQYRQLNPRHKRVSTRYPNLLQVGQQAQILLNSLVSIAVEYLIELRICSNPEWSSLPNSQCCSIALFAPYGTELVNQINQLEQSPSRQGCHCLKTIDIGMDNTCVSGCRYCYAVQSQETAVKNFKQHDPQKPMLR